MAKEEINELRAKLNEKINSLSEINNSISSIEMTSSYKDWAKEYSKTVNEIKKIKKSKNMNMDAYQKASFKFKKLMASKPKDLAELEKKKKTLIKEIQDLKAQIRALKRGKSKTQEESNTPKKEGVKAVKELTVEERENLIKDIKQLIESQALCSKVEVAQNLTTLSEKIETVIQESELNAKESIKKYKNSKPQIENAKKEFENTIANFKAIQSNTENSYEKRKQDLETEKIKKLAQVEICNSNIDIYLNKAESDSMSSIGNKTWKEHQNEYLKWSSDITNINNQIKKLRESQDISSDEKQAQYRELLIKRKKLEKPYMGDEAKGKNPIIVETLKRNQIIAEINKIEIELVRNEQARKKAIEQAKTSLESLSANKNSQLVKVEKQNVFSKFFSRIAKIFNNKKKANVEVIAPMKNTNANISKITAELEEACKNYLEEVKAEKTQPGLSISQTIQKGKMSRENITLNLASKIIDGKDNVMKKEVTKTKQKKEVQVGMEIGG